MRNGVIVGVLVLCSAARAADFPEWRNVGRDNKSADVGLLKSWPQGGPKLAWSINTLGKGYSSVSVAGGSIYTTGTNKDNQGVLYCLDSSGKLVWEKVYGAEPRGGYSSARNTPTVNDGCIYITSSMGDLNCFDAKTGDKKWAFNTLEKFKARNIQWHVCESPVIDGDTLFLTPGGAAGMVALNKKTGDVLWQSSLGMDNAYCSPLLLKLEGRKVLVQMLSSAVAGIDAKDGAVLWKHPFKNKYSVHPNTPVFADGIVYASAGYGFGGVGLKLSPDGAKAALAYKSDMSVHHGGIVEDGGHVYAAADGGMTCVDIKAGKTLWQSKKVGKGSIVWADGLLYVYSEKGEVSLVKSSPTDCEVVSQFPITQGSGQHWAHPVVADGKLFIRHGEALMAYEVK